MKEDDKLQVVMATIHTTFISGYCQTQVCAEDYRSLMVSTERAETLLVYVGRRDD